MVACASIGRLLAVIAGLLVTSSYGQVKPRCAENPSAAPTRLSPEQPANLLEALAGIGRASGVCMAVELIDGSLADRAVTRHIDDRSPAESAVRSLLADVPQYCVEIRGKILSVAPCDREHNSWLDFGLTLFKANAGQIQAMSWALSMWLSDAVEPRKGYLGHFRSGNPADTVGPYDSANRTVRELLDLFVGDSRGAMWITVKPYRRRSADDVPSQFWFIAEYGEEWSMRSVLPQVRSGFAHTVK